MNRKGRVGEPLTSLTPPTGRPARPWPGWPGCARARLRRSRPNPALRPRPLAARRSVVTGLRPAARPRRTGRKRAAHGPMCGSRRGLAHPRTGRCE